MASDHNGQLQEMSFWDHLDALRSVLIKGIIVLLVMGIVLFAFMPWIFDNIILAPCRGNFVLYRLMDNLSALSGIMPDVTSGDFNVNLINIQLASQFFIHMSASCWMAVMLSFPIIIYLLWTFISPGLYEHERRGA
ncbi:MAG: twin-arginine translocase subunit TatC, partial [Muribaculaceae bacterium]|nr:twin-arginine translocase subunit TatC [Muribaculaceae bacterium]